MRLQIFGFMIISNHTHLIANNTTVNLSDTVQDFKKFTFRQNN